MRNPMFMSLTLVAVLTATLPGNRTLSQDSRAFQFYEGDQIPASVEAMYVRGLDFLARSQSSTGAWNHQYGTEPGVVGLGLLAFLAHGEDPNYGPYSKNIQRAVDFLIANADSSTGYIGTSMYNHGFATLALAEAYGVVNNPKIGPAVRKAINLILESQAQNNLGGWRYSPQSTDADTTVSGAQMVALFAARNAGLGVPDAAIGKGLQYYETMQSGDGGFGYTSPGGSNAPRTAIGALVFALAREKDDTAFKAAYRYLQRQGYQQNSYPYYYIYYAAQAYFHADMEGWKVWNEQNQKVLQVSQTEDGSWQGNHGPVFSTSTALLSLAVNYRFVPIYER